MSGGGGEEVTTANPALDEWSLGPSVEYRAPETTAFIKIARDKAMTGWHRHGPDSDVVHRTLDSPQWCDHPQNVPVLVADLAGAREQIARAIFLDVNRQGRGYDVEDWDVVPQWVRDEYLATADDVLAALGAPEEGEDRG